jgi:CheY-like chemotaxis protein
MDSNAARPHILVCDDDHALRRIFREILADEGYRVTVQATVCEAIDDVIALAPDLIVLDLIFGGEPRGLEFLRHLKSTPETRAIAVLTCTATAVVDDEIQRHLTAWECASIEKPFDLEALIATVQECLGTTEVAV